MTYTVGKLAALSGVSARTLRHYDDIGLLKPAAVGENGYRAYGTDEVDRLQQILFYRELGFALCDIAELLDAPGFDRTAALAGHLNALSNKRKRLDALILTVERTIASSKGEISMKDNEKFEGFKRDLISENEQKYGAEVREKYGDSTVDASNAKMMGMTEERYAEVQELSAKINELLNFSIATGDPACEQAQEMCRLHREWLEAFWADGTYSKQAHRALGEGYVADERFKAYYDAIADGGAEFLRDALNIYCAE